MVILSMTIFQQMITIQKLQEWMPPTAAIMLLPTAILPTTLALQKRAVTTQEWEMAIKATSQEWLATIQNCTSKTQ